MLVQSVPFPGKRPFAVSGFHAAFIIAWAICLRRDQFAAITGLDEYQNKGRCPSYG